MYLISITIAFILIILMFYYLPYHIYQITSIHNYSSVIALLIIVSTLILICLVYLYIDRIKYNKRVCKDILTIDENNYKYINRRTKEEISPDSLAKKIKEHGIYSIYDEFFAHDYIKQWTIHNSKTKSDEKYVLLKR